MVDPREDTVTRPTPVERLAEDHARVRTNFVTGRHPEPLKLVENLAGGGVLADTIAPGVMRLVTHHDVDDEGLERAVVALAVAP